MSKSVTQQYQPDVIFLMGPTASGKTQLAMELVQHHNCEIVSVDSAMIYRGMDIGSAKPSKQELLLAPHALIDILEPTESYSAAEFRHDALHLIQVILAKGKTPLLVGGTMMYFKSLLEGLSPLPAADTEIRAEILDQAERQGWQALHNELAQIDPVSAARIHPNDPQRLSRAIEVYRISGQTLTELTQVKDTTFPYRVTQFAIAPSDRKYLHDLIAQRFAIMLRQGFIDEVQSLRQRGDLHLDLPSMRCVGYRQCWQYLEGEFDLTCMVDKAVAATRQLAKRQLTWLRKWPSLEWLETGDDGNLMTIMKHKNKC